jgi:hypothetical protein
VTKYLLYTGEALSSNPSPTPKKKKNNNKKKKTQKNKKTNLDFGLCFTKHTSYYQRVYTMQSC